MNQFQFTTKLSNYLNMIESETGRSIRFQLARELDSSEYPFGFTIHPKFILILYAMGTDLESPDHEHSIAHEATHGYVLYKLGYSHINLKPNVSQNEVRHISLLFTMIDDIVVNKIIYENGFPPFASNYLGMVKFETKVSRKSKDSFYDRYPGDPLFKDRIMVFRYIMAWSFITYFNLDSYSSKILNKFLKAFQTSFNKQFLMANKIIDLISQHDIFNSNGHHIVIEAVLKLWQLDDLIELRIRKS